ncbi:MAG: DUF192 domain-containing protein [Candidatus Devosia phytovorans]|uniref:DUF192 domain-containing protein n=1 Tax=Candidatus Devosia phytovorans TaxID=3121372 RepID=A0AAJ6B243_9HYPH|nr:DUF192 domain-containing protein [Devosia sp.]WEK06396.1 MAG: DUF192 domain-containing protein [Devosia sp.]
MLFFAQGLAPVLRRAGATIALAAMLAPLATMADESTLVLHSETGDHTFTVEVVDTPESRAKGLMYVTELADDAGMLFDFKEERPVSFWMMNTFIPLDMIFVDAEGVIQNIHVNARPHDVTGIPSDGPVQFVLEIPGGRSEELGIKAGDTMEHDRVTTPAG